MRFSSWCSKITYAASFGGRIFVSPRLPPTSFKVVVVLASTFDLPWMIVEWMAGTAGPMPFNTALPEDVPTGQIDPLLIAHAAE
jgi:hypothetical protein